MIYKRPNRSLVGRTTYLAIILTSLIVQNVSGFVVTTTTTTTNNNNAVSQKVIFPSRKNAVVTTLGSTTAAAATTIVAPQAVPAVKTTGNKSKQVKKTNNNKNKKTTGSSKQKNPSATSKVRNSQPQKKQEKTENGVGVKVNRKKRNTKYMIRRWKSQQEAKNKKRDEKEKNANKLVSAIGMKVGPNQKSKNQIKKKTVKGQSVPAQKKTVKQKKTIKQKKSTKPKESRPVVQATTEAQTETPTEPKSALSWMELRPGSRVSGKIMKVLPYGALVQTPYDIPGKTEGFALLHISQISNEMINNITDVFHVGQEIKDALVVSLNRNDGKVQLSLRNQTKRAIPLETLQIGDEVEGKVVRLKQYGAFVDIGCKRNALLHISRISMYKVENISDHVNVGDMLKVRVIRVDADQKNIAVSMLSPENDRFVDRRVMQNERTRLWQRIIDAEDEDMEETKRQLLELDKALWDDFHASLGMPRTLEV